MMGPLIRFLATFFQWKYVLLAVLLYVAVQYVLFVYVQPLTKNAPPGVYGYPLVGILPTVAFSKRPIGDILKEYADRHGSIFRLAMGIQEVFMVHGEEAVVAALKSPDLTGWPIHVRSRVGERRIDWRRVENDIKQALEGNGESDTVDSVMFSKPSRSTGYSTPQICGRYEEPNVRMILKASAAIIKCCISMKSGIAGDFEWVTKNLGDFIMPVDDDIASTPTSNDQFNDDLAEDAALSFFRQGRHEEVVEILAEVLLCRNSSTDTECDDFATAIRNELNSLKEPPSWNMGERLPILMGFIAYGYRVAHRRHFLIRRCVREVSLQGYVIPKDAVLVFNLGALSPKDSTSPAASKMTSCSTSNESTPLTGLNTDSMLSTDRSWPFVLGNRICPPEMAGLLYVFHSLVHLVLG